MSNSEYESLRAENVSRIQMITVLDNSVLVITGSLWAAVAAISGNLLTNNAKLKLIIQLLLLIIAAVLIIVAALKNWENVHQILVVAAYIRVFYEYPSRHTDKLDLLSWETTQMQTNALRNSKWSKQKNLLFRAFYNGSYLILEFTTAVIMAAVVINAGIRDLPAFEKVVLICVLIAIWSIIFVTIFKLTFVNGFTDEKQKELFMLYANKALELGVIDETMYEIQSKVDPAEIISDEILREMRS